MGHGVVVGSLQAAYAASLGPRALRFARALRDPERAQAAILRDFVERNAATVYGRAHRYERCKNPRDFQDRVPIVDYEALRPYVERLADGEPRVLTREEALVFERTSGSSGGDKLIPYTQALLDEFGAATAPWLFDLTTHRPALLGTRSYWSVSPVARERQYTRGGVPVGFDDDTAYFGELSRRLLSRLLAVPGTVAHAGDMERWRRATAEHLLLAADLGFVSVWSPTFLTELLHYVERDLTPLLVGLPRERAREIQKSLDRMGRFSAEAIWPRLALVSCWTDAQAARFLPELRKLLPSVEIQGKGLLATEGVVTLPLLSGLGRAAPVSPVAAVASHFLEFVDVARPNARPRLVHELEVGASYAPLLTTAGGFARYRLPNLLVCEGYHFATPCLRFVGRLDKASDLCGEKLTGPEVERAVEQALKLTDTEASFTLVAPRLGTPPRYVLYVEAPRLAPNLATALESELCRGHHYRYCRNLGQLGPAEAVQVEAGWLRYRDALTARGMRLGDIKPTTLDARTFWSDVFDSPRVS